MPPAILVSSPSQLVFSQAQLDAHIAKLESDPFVQGKTLAVMGTVDQAGVAAALRFKSSDGHWLLEGAADHALDGPITSGWDAEGKLIVAW